MSQADFEPAFKLLLEHEGGYVDNKSDPGGATKYGVSLRFLSEEGKDINQDGVINKKDIADLTADGAKEIYKEKFWDENNINLIESQRLANMTFGLCVQMGAPQAILLLQRAANIINVYNKKKKIKEDGALGPRTLENINKMNEPKLIKEFKDRATMFYSLLAAKNAKYNVFLKGWIKRVISY